MSRHAAKKRTKGKSRKASIKRAPAEGEDGTKKDVARGTGSAAGSPDAAGPGSGPVPDPGTSGSSMPGEGEHEEAESLSRLTYELSVKQEDEARLAEIEAAVRAISYDSLVWDEKFDTRLIEHPLSDATFSVRISALLNDEEVGLYDLEVDVEGIEGVQRLNFIDHHVLR